MTAAWLDFSLRPELGLHARVVADIESVAVPMGIGIVITGAFARDLHLSYRCGIDMQRKTEDIDFGLAVADWAVFAALREGLSASGNFEASAGGGTGFGTATAYRSIWCRLAASRRVSVKLSGRQQVTR